MARTTLRLDLKVRDYDIWRAAFDRDAGGRRSAGMRRYRIFRPVDDPHRVMIDGDFDTPDEPRGFLEIMRTKVWPDPEKAPAKVGDPNVRIIELVEAREYQPASR